jgi:hypothetical protein
MSVDRTTPEPLMTAAMAGATEWLALSDDLLAGLVHALNNRVTALSVCVELATLGDDQMLRDGMMTVEARRLQRASALLGLLPARGQPEALEVAPVLEDALAIHEQHPRMRGIDCRVSVLAAPPPVRVPRWALLRLLLVMMHEAKSAAVDSGHKTVTIELSGDARELQIRAPARENLSVYAAALATLCGGALGRQEDDAVCTLPGLAEVRRREGAASPSG